jgi:hypothetical protein
MITNYLVAHPTALVDGDSGATDPVARLIEDLIASGVEGVQRPRCLDCGESKPLVRRMPGGRVCDRCRHRRRPQEKCPQCGMITRRAKRHADGKPICARCHQLTYVPTVHRCVVCGVNRTYRTKKRICREWAELPHTSCAACGLPAAAATPTDGSDPRCSHCATGASAVS